MNSGPSTLAAGRYRLGDVLGEGGMAVVYVAHDMELGVDRAVKVLLPSTGRSTVRKRLRNEAKAMARLRHPHILGIHDVGSEGEDDYIVMDLAPGGSLQMQVGADGPIPLGRALATMVKVLSALAAAHAAGIVHRDVKPHNILLDHNGEPLLADFGIAMLAEADRSTRTGVAMGSLAFMPPEQRLDAAHVGPTADIYACGCTLFAILTNDNPVDLFLAPPESDRWSGVPQPVRAVVQRACAPHPSDRYETAGAMADALLAVLDGLGPDERERALNSRGFFPDPSEILATGRSRVPATAAPRPPPLTVGDSTVAPGGSNDPTLVPHPTVMPDPAPARPTAPLTVMVALALAASVVLCAGWGLQGVTSQASGPVTGPETPALPMPGADATERGADAAEPGAAEPGAAGPDEADPDANAPDTAAPDAAAPDIDAPEPRPATPAPEPAPRRPPRNTKASPVDGRWSGSLNGRITTLELSGAPEGLRGAFTTTWRGKDDVSPVQGRFDPETQMLRLEDVGDGMDTGTYVLTLAGDRLEGSFMRTAGGEVRLSLHR